MSSLTRIAAALALVAMVAGCANPLLGNGDDQSSSEDYEPNAYHVQLAADAPVMYDLAELETGERIKYVRINGGRTDILGNVSENVHAQRFRRGPVTTYSM